MCRSPYCEYVFKRMIDGNEDIVVNSAATLHQASEIHDKARQALLREGFDIDYINAHQPRWIYKNMHLVKEADVIIGMVKSHRILIPLPYKKKFITLSEAVTGKYTPIKDPWLEKDMNVYFEAMDEIKEYLEAYKDKLLSKKSKNS